MPTLLQEHYFPDDQPKRLVSTYEPPSEIAANCRRRAARYKDMEQQRRLLIDDWDDGDAYEPIGPSADDDADGGGEDADDV